MFWFTCTFDPKLIENSCIEKCIFKNLITVCVDTILALWIARYFSFFFFILTFVLIIPRMPDSSLSKILKIIRNYLSLFD